MTDRFDAIVIGAGHNGLVCAAYLARAGKSVVCLEAGESMGGMLAGSMVGSDYRVPGLAHVAYPVSDTLRKDLDLDRFGYVAGRPVDTIALGENGEHLTIGEQSVVGPGLPDADAAGYPGFRQELLRYAKALRPMFENAPPRLKHMSRSDTRILAKLGWNLRFGLGRDSMNEFLRVAAINVYDLLNDALEDDRLKGALALDAVLGCQMGPRTPGSVLIWLQRLSGELNGPQRLLAGGSGQLVDALAQSAQAAGASIRLGARVARVLVGNGKATGVELTDGEAIEAPIVVSNADPQSTFLDLVGAPQLDAMFARRVSQIRGRGVVAGLHLGLSDLPDFVGLDRAALGNRLVYAPSMKYVERAFNHSKYDECSDHPVLEITIPSLHNDALAPDGHHVMSINIAYVPYDVAGGWHDQKAAVADKVISTVGRFAPELRSLIVNHELVTPDDIQDRYLARQGHWHHGDMTIHQSFMLRPLYGAAQYHTPIDGLYLCGAGAHPGGGVTGMPGRNAARRILDAGNTA